MWWAAAGVQSCTQMYRKAVMFMGVMSFLGYTVARSQRDERERGFGALGFWPRSGSNLPASKAFRQTS